MMLDLVRELGERFSPEAYLVLTRVQGTLWTAADFVIIYYLIRITNLLRGFLGRRSHIGAPVVLAATAPLALLLPFVSAGWTFFLLELAITIPGLFVFL